MIYQNNLDLTPYNSYRIHCIAKKAYFPESESEICELLRNLDNVVIIGGGCNVIFSKEVYETENFVFLRNNYAGASLIEENLIQCHSGTDLQDVSLFALEKGLSGFEIYYDIPGTIGGAVVMNAGAQGEDFAHLLESVIVYDKHKSCIRVLEKSVLGYDYRNSLFLDNSNLFILSATIRLTKGCRQQIREKMLLTKVKRWEKQPREYPSAGSVFKRPVGCYVGPMIEELDLKGYSIGDAQISEKHGGFVVNKGHATGEDLVKLIQYVKSKVYEKYKIDLSVEQRII